MKTIRIVFTQEGDTLHCRAYGEGGKATKQEEVAAHLMRHAVESFSMPVLVASKAIVRLADQKRPAKRRKTKS